MTDSKLCERLLQRDPVAVAQFAKVFRSALETAYRMLIETSGPLGVPLDKLVPWFAEAIARGYLHELRDGPRTLADYVASRRLPDLLLVAACLAEVSAALVELHVRIPRDVKPWLDRTWRDNSSPLIRERAVMGLADHLLGTATKGRVKGQPRLVAYRGQGYLKRFLRSTGKNYLTELMRQEQKIKRAAKDRGETPPHPDEDLKELWKKLRQRFHEFVQEKLCAMPPRQAMAARLRWSQRMRPSEIADLMRLSRARVSQLLGKASEEISAAITDLCRQLAPEFGLKVEEIRRGFYHFLDQTSNDDEGDSAGGIPHA